MIKEQITKLAHSWKGDTDALDIIKSDLQACGDYIQAVYSMEYSIPIIRARYEGDEVRYRITMLDTNRHAAHDRAIMGVKRLNRFSSVKGLAIFYKGDPDDRYQVADFCKEIVNELFDGRDLHITVD